MYEVSDIFLYSWFRKVKVNQNTVKNHHSNHKLKISKLCYCRFSQIKITSVVELNLLSRGTYVHIYLITRGTSIVKSQTRKADRTKRMSFSVFFRIWRFFAKTPLLIYHGCRYHSQIVNPLQLQHHWTLPFSHTTQGHTRKYLDSIFFFQVIIRI